MKFVVSSTALLNRLQTASRVINSKNSLPILDCFLFELENNILTIIASDNENRLLTRLEVVESDSNACFCINAKTIQDSMKEISEQPMMFEIDLQTMEIKGTYQNGTFSIMGQSADNFPQPNPTNYERITLEIPAETLCAGINRCLFASADDELRPVMNGIYFDITTENITFVASDGHKLVRNKALNVKGPEKSAFILPKKPANILKNILPKESDDVKISFASKNATMTMSNFELTCRLIEGRFPNYNSVIPTNNPNRVIVDRLMFLSALRRVLVFSNQSSALIKLHLEDNLLVISGQDYDFSTSAEERIPCSYDGPMFNIGFKGTFLTDILNNLTSTEVIIELADPSRAGVIIPAEQDENEDTLMLLMPMMLND